MELSAAVIQPGTGVAAGDRVGGRAGLVVYTPAGAPDAHGQPIHNSAPLQVAQQTAAASRGLEGRPEGGRQEGKISGASGSERGHHSSRTPLCPPPPMLSKPAEKQHRGLWSTWST
jgi:hypothetical protein